MRYIKIKNAIISVSDKTNLESLISYFEKKIKFQYIQQVELINFLKISKKE